MAYLDEHGLKTSFELVKKAIDKGDADNSKKISDHIADHNNPHVVTKEQLGYASANLDVSAVFDPVQPDNNMNLVIHVADGFGSTSNAGVALTLATAEKNGLMSKDDKGKLDKLRMDDAGVIDASNLPSYVDDVVEGYYNPADGKFYKEDAYTTAIEGETGKIYTDLSQNGDNKVYRYASGQYIAVSDVPKETLNKISSLEADNTTNKTDISNLKKNVNTLQDDVHKMVNISYADLKELRDNNKLEPGRQYRITDYQCTTTQANTQSAGHQFDIIVTADSEGKLNEVARAIRNSGDEYLDDNLHTKEVAHVGYFEYYKSKLEAWKIWYCLDNDTNRFSWADERDGKGVIYRMIDEFGNDLPYDFKNIQFKMFKITTANVSSLVGRYLGRQTGNNPMGVNVDTNDFIWSYTFNYSGKDENGSVKYYDGSLGDSMEETRPKVRGNIMKLCVINGAPILNYNVFQMSGTQTDCLGNIFDEGCLFNSFGALCCYNKFSSVCSTNIFGSNFLSNTFGYSCMYNVLGDSATNNIFGAYVISVLFGNNCQSNVIGDYCMADIYGDNCSNNTFGDKCGSIMLQNWCCNNTFESGAFNLVLSGTGSNEKNIKNYHIKRGMYFDHQQYPISAKAGLAYEMTVAKQSDGTVVQYCEADLLKAISDATINQTATDTKLS